MTRRPELDELLPLGAKLFHILLALAEDDRHGYSLSKDIEAATNGAIRLGPGTLYGLLKQMLIDGWIVEVGGHDGEDSRRRYYRLTPAGRAIARAEAERMADLVRTARARKLLPAQATV